MLHFVFFHWPQPAADRDVYVGRLIHFHERLKQALPTGEYSGSVVFEMDSPPGLVSNGRVFADWYAINTWGFVDTFKNTAVGAVAAEHAAIAQLMEGGVGAMYDVRAGASALPGGAEFSYWFGKPVGMSYAGLDALLAPLTAENGVTLWQRQLVLGPTPEFVLTSAAALTLPGEIVAQTRALRQV